MGWWQNSASLTHFQNRSLYESCTYAPAPCAKAKPVTTSKNRHDDGVWQSAVSCTDNIAPDTGTKLDKLITRHDYGARQTTLCGMDATTPGAKAKLVISMNCMMTTLGDLRNVTQKQPCLTQRRNYRRKGKPRLMRMQNYRWTKRLDYCVTAENTTPL